jgi:transposase
LPVCVTPSGRQSCKKPQRGITCSPGSASRFLHASQNGRALTLADNERFIEKLRRSVRSKKGRARLRARTAVEHRLAHVSRRTGTRTRYGGIPKNEFGLRRTAAVLNLEVLNLRQPLEIRSISNRSAR